MDLLTGMEFDLFVPSFPQLQSHFHLSASWVEALLSVNFIGYCISVLIVGNLSDRYGRKPIILLGLIVFVIGSLVCLVENDFTLLLLGRLLQGIGIAAPAILSFLIIADHYPLQKQQFLMAMLNGSMNIAVGISPVIGSYIALYFHWRGNFTVLLSLGILACILTLFFVPQYSLPDKKQNQTSTGYITLFQSKPLLLVMIFLVVMCLPYWIFVGMSPLLYMKNFGVKLSVFGFYQGILAFVFALGSIIFGLVMHRFTQQKLLSIGLKIFIVSLILIGFITVINSSSPLFITLTLLIFVIGQIIPGTILYPLCLSLMPDAKARISAISQSARLIFSSLALQIAGYFYNGSFRNTGIIILIFILMTIIMQFYVMKNIDHTEARA